MSEELELSRLYHERPKSQFLRVSAVLSVLMLFVTLGSFASGLAELAEPKRQANIARFLSELSPYSLRNAESSFGEYLQWYVAMFEKSGAYAMAVTFALSLIAIVIAAALAFFISPFAARTLAKRDPYLVTEKPCLPCGIVKHFTRVLMMFMRAIPEYIWAFIFLTLVGPSAWPAILALAIHNAGVLGRLQTETIENLTPTPLRSVRAFGASRIQLFLAAVAPMSFSRFLLFFFARWEMCVRESTVLGLLGIVSLGSYIQDARARNFYDEMFFFIVLGGVLVLFGDILSAIVRAYTQRSIHFGRQVKLKRVEYC